MASASLFPWLQVLLVLCCALEESLELASLRRSHVLYHFVSLVFELLSSVLRIPIRFLVCVRACKRVHLHEFATLAQDLTLRLGLWTDEDQSRELTLATLEAQLSEERRRNAFYTRVQNQYAQARTELRHARAENHRLDIRLRSYEEELATYHLALQQKCREFDSVDEKANEAKSHILGRLASVESQNVELQSEVERAAARIRILNARLHDEKDLSDRERRLLEHSLLMSQEQCRLVKLGAQRLENSRMLTIHKLLYLVLLVHGFALHLGERLAPALRSKDSLVARWQTLSAQKVEARRALIRYLHCNTDLQQELRQLSARVADVEKEALQYRARHNESVKARDAAAKKFKKFYYTMTTRYTNNTTQLLTGLLVLWRLNLVLTRRLAFAQDTRHAEALAPPARRHRLVEFVDAAVQCIPDEPELSDAGVQCSPGPQPTASFSSVGVQCISAPRISEKPVARDPVHAPAVTVPPTLKDTSTGSSAFMFCVPSESSSALSQAPTISSSKQSLLPPGDGAGTSLSSSPSQKLDRSELSERVQRLLEKFEALSAVHQSYRNLLLEKTRSIPPTPAASPRKESGLFQDRAPLLLDHRRSLAASIHAC